MKKNFVLAILVAWLAATAVVRAGSDDFVANADITVTDISFSGSTISLIILNGSTSASWNQTDGVMAVVDPGPAFKIATVSSATSVKMITATQNNVRIACADNGTPGTSSLILPTTPGTYTITPSASSPCSQPIISVPVSAPASSPASTPATTPPPAADQTQTTTKPPTTAPPAEEKSTSSKAAELKEKLESLVADAGVITQSRENVLFELGRVRDAKVEAKVEKTLVKQVIAGVKGLKSDVKEKVVTFVAYGTPSTENIGANERAGVLTSFKEAFGKLPKTQTDWNDIIKIANGEPPAQVSKKKEKQAAAAFKVIYGRAAKAGNAKDEAAVDSLAYGVRPTEKSLAAERAAIKTYQTVFRRLPKTSSDWAAVRTIAYSGIPPKKIPPKK